MNKRNLKASFASGKMKWRRFFIGCFRPCAWRVVGVGRYFLNYIYTRCGKIQDLYFSTPIYKKLEKPVPTCQVLHCVKKHTYVLVRMYLCLSLNVLAFWIKRPCVLGWMNLRFKKSDTTWILMLPVITSVTLWFNRIRYKFLQLWS